MDYLGNTPEYYQLLVTDIEQSLESSLKPLGKKDISVLKGTWMVEGYNFDDLDTYEFDGVEEVSQSTNYHYYKIPASGILSLYLYYEAMPEFGVSEEGYAEEAFYAHWVNKEIVHLSNPDSSLQWLLKKQA